jgi:predicted enzyme related to lactoylglutathione lyase
MRRVTGVGGIFFKAKDPDALLTWYRVHLGIESQEWGGTAFPCKRPDNPDGDGKTAWAVFGATTDYFAPSTSQFMINYTVENLHELLSTLRAEGCAVDAKVDESEFGKFGWVMDPEGNRIELWEPAPAK